MEKDKNKSAFKTPENYFEELEDQLFTKIAVEKFPKFSGFKVPNDYFEMLETRVVDTVKLPEKTGKVLPLFSKKQLGYAAAIAASLLIFFSVFNNTKEEKYGMDSLQSSAIGGYIEDGYLNIDLYDLTSYLDDEDISYLKQELPQLSETTLENYLLEYFDEETLMNEQ